MEGRLLELAAVTGRALRGMAVAGRGGCVRPALVPGGVQGIRDSASKKTQDCVLFGHKAALTHLELLLLVERCAVLNFDCVWSQHLVSYRGGAAAY